MIDKRMTMPQIVSEIKSGDTVVMGGAGVNRKPMALVRAIAQSDIRDLTVVAFIGGPDVDLLIGAGKVKRLLYACVYIEGVGLAPNFRRARESAAIEVSEWSEYTVLAGLEAAAKRLPFFPVRSGLGSDIARVNPAFRPFQAPFTGETLIAVPAIRPDVALIHVNTADSSGYGLIEGELYIDPLIARAAKKTFLSAERVMPADELRARPRDRQILRIWVQGVTAAPMGAYFTSCYPDYRADFNYARQYMAASASPEAFKAFLDQWVSAPSMVGAP